MLIEYHFEIKHVKDTDNARVDALSKKAELQGSIKPSDAILCIDKDRKIRIQEAKEQDPDSKEYKNRELIYILNKLAKEFIKDFH